MLKQPYIHGEKLPKRKAQIKLCFLKLAGHVTHINRWDFGGNRREVWKTLPEQVGEENVGTCFLFRPKAYLSARHCTLELSALD